MAHEPLDLRKPTIEAVRWYILRTLDAGRPGTVGEDIIRRTLEDSHFRLTPHELRRELDYLHDRKLLEVSGRDNDHWGAELTALGIDVVEYTVDCKPGIARPSRRS